MTAIGRSSKLNDLIVERIVLVLRTEMETQDLQIVRQEYQIQRLVKILLEDVALMNLEALIIRENKIKVFPSSSHPISNDSSPATLGIMALLVTLLE